MCNKKRWLTGGGNFNSGRWPHPYGGGTYGNIRWPEWKRKHYVKL